MADSAADVADDLAALGTRIRAAAAAELDRQADISKDALAADTRRDRGVTAESWRHDTLDGGMTHRVSNDATDEKGRYIATIVEYGYNDGQPDAVVEREAARAEKRVPDAVMDAVVEELV